MPFSEYDIECIRNAKQIIDADLRQHHSISDLAEKSFIGQTKLKEGFNLLYGIPIFKYLREQRMIKAAELLRDKNYTLKQIAKSVGFKYTSNFIIAFVKFHGATPGMYRKHL